MNKKIISKEEFLSINKIAANKMYNNKELTNQARDILIEADKYRWIHQTTWLGEPILNLAEDMFAIQDIIWKTKPDYIIEVGVAWGGAILFEAMLLKLIGGKKVIGVDVFLSENMINRLKSHDQLSNIITLIQGSSIEKNTFEKIESIIGKSDKVMVILDSDHTSKHVLKELMIYSKLVKKNNYLICCDTIIDNMPERTHHGQRAWGPNNGPLKGLNDFLSNNDRFIVDEEIEEKMLFTSNPGGYLKAVY